MTNANQRTRWTLITGCILSLVASASGASGGLQHHDSLSCMSLGGRPISSGPVGLEQFAKLHCKPYLTYFQALDAASPPQYEELRKALRWTQVKRIEFRGGVSSGEERRTLSQGVEVLRQYSNQESDTYIVNTTGAALFVESVGLKPSGDTTGARAYVAVAPSSRRRVSVTKAMVADPIWDSEVLQISEIIEL